MKTTDIIKELVSLRDRRKLIGEVYRSKAYDHAIESLIKSGIQEVNSIDQIKGLPGFGTTIVGRIQSLLETGQVGDPIVDQERIIELFNDIYSVGPKTAKHWYDLGYRQISDIPYQTLKPRQQIGIYYYEQYKQRIPYSIINQFDQEISRYAALYGIEVIICGSYRRRKPDSGDIDMLVYSIFKYEPSYIFDVITRYHKFKYTLAQGNKKYHGLLELDGLHRRIDLEFCTLEEVPYALLYFTGSKEHNELMRGKAKQFGWRLNEKSMIVEATREKIYAENEEDIFRLLQIEYKSPEAR